MPTDATVIYGCEALHEAKQCHHQATMCSSLLQELLDGQEKPVGHLSYAYPTRCYTLIPEFDRRYHPFFQVFAHPNLHEEGAWSEQEHETRFSFF